MAKTFRIQPLREGGLPNLNRLVGEVNKEFDRIARAIDDILAGRAAFTGNLNLGGFRATNAGNPRGAQDLVTLDYAEDSLGGGSTDADLTSEGEGGGSTSDGTSEQSDGGDDYLSLLDNVAATGVVFGEDDGGGGAILQTDVSNFVWNDTYDILMVGRSALGSTGTVASGIVSQRSVEAIGDGTDGNMRCTSYGAVPQWLSRKTLGTEALPTAVTAGTELFQIRSEGAYSVTPDWAQGFRFQIWAAENWTSGNNGSYLTLALTPIGTGPTTTEVLRLVPENAEATPLITLMGDTDTGIWHPAADTLALSVGAAEIMRWTTGAVTVNEDGDDVDFRVETTGVPNGFVVDFGANKVGMNNVLYTWPTAFVGAGTLLVDTDGAGTLAWETLATAGVSARPHNFLDSAEHNNVTTAVPVRGDVITGQGVTPTWTRLAVGVNNQILKNDETDVVWGKVDLADTTAEITGTLPYSNGGTGQTAWAQGDLLYASAANTLALLNVGVVNTVLVSNGTVPGWSATLAGLTLTSPTIGDFTNAGHNHEAAGGGGQLDHGAALTGLTDDDHTQYILADGTRAFSAYIDIDEAAVPGTPGANVMRIYAEDFHGFPFLSFKDDGGQVRKLVRDSVFLAYNNRGTTIAAGRIVYATGAFGDVPTIDTAQADAAATMPAIGVTVESIADGAYGRVMQVGLLENVNTAAYAAGDVLYVSATTAGVPTATAPLWPNLRQEIGTILISDASAGAIQLVARTTQNDGVVNHGGLLGLTDDTHSQYALLLGRSGGQTLIGGVDASDDLTLYSTSDATKGNVIFGLAGTSVYDEVNSRWGIGTAAPEFQCHVVGSGAGTLSGWSWLFDTPNVVIQSDGSGRAAGLALVGGSGGCYLYMGDNSGTPEVDWGGLVYSNTHYLYFRANDATRATLTPTGLFQTTGGFKTTVAGPTVPFDPDGNNTLCTSLNADLLDGYEATTLPIAGDVTGTLAASVVGKINGVAYNADPLAQYLLLAGRAGAANDFTLSTSTDGNITGSSAASADLYLHGNSNDQAGLIRLQDELYLREDFPTIGAGETKYAACFNPTVTTSGASSSVMRCFCINPTLLLTAAASFVDGFYFNPTVTNSAPYVYTCVTNTGTHTSTYTGAGQGTVTVFNNTVTCQTAAASGKISNVLAFQDSGIVKVNDAVTAATLASLRSFRSAPVVNAVASGTINVTDVYGYLAEGTASGSGTKNVTNRYGYYVKNFSGATALTNQYGIYIEALTSGATINTSLVSAGTSTQMRHAGPVYIGASATAPTEKLHIGSGNLRIEGGSSTGFINLGEYNTTSDPSAPADNRVILYCRDNGAGKEQLCARFNTGAVQVLATEP